MQILVGLGNPGVKYKSTRHNVGFILLDELANQNRIKFNTQKKFKADVAELNNMHLVKPLTFMNESGVSVELFLSYYKLLPTKLHIFKRRDIDLSPSLVVVHDDLDIKFGEYKISTESRSAGHRGVESIIQHLKTKKFKRIRVGIKTLRDPNMKTSDFVLQKFSSSELLKLKNVIKEIIIKEIDF